MVVAGSVGSFIAFSLLLYGCLGCARRGFARVTVLLTQSSRALRECQPACVLDRLLREIGKLEAPALGQILDSISRRRAFLLTILFATSLLWAPQMLPKLPTGFALSYIVVATGTFIAAYIRFVTQGKSPVEVTATAYMLYLVSLPTFALGALQLALAHLFSVPMLSILLLIGLTPLLAFLLHVSRMSYRWLRLALGTAGTLVAYLYLLAMLGIYNLHLGPNVLRLQGTPLYLSLRLLHLGATAITAPPDPFVAGSAHLFVQYLVLSLFQLVVVGFLVSIYSQDCSSSACMLTSSPEPSVGEVVRVAKEEHAASDSRVEQGAAPVR